MPCRQTNMSLCMITRTAASYTCAEKTRSVAYVRTLAWQSVTQTKKHSRVQSVHTPLDLGARCAQLEAHAARLDALAELLHVAHADVL